MINTGPCAQCKCEVWIPDALYESAKRSHKVGFFCSFGHPLHFSEGENEADKLRRERDRLAQQIAERDDRIRQERERAEAAERRASAARGQVTRIRNRVSHGG